MKLKTEIEKRYKIVSDIESEIKEILLSWTEGSYDQDDIQRLKSLSIPQEYRNVYGELYRGERFDEQTISEITKQKAYTYGVSWTTDNKIAKNHALDHDGMFGIIWKYKPKPDDILLNVSSFVKKNNIKLPYDEDEIILKNNISVSKKNIESIHW